MSKILCIVDGMTDPSFRAEDHANLSSMRLARYVDTCRGQNPESLGCILRLLGVQKIPANFRGYVEALGNDIAVNSNDLVVRGSWFALDSSGNCTVPTQAPENLPEVKDYRYYPLGQYKSIFVFPGMAGFVTDITTCPPYACENIAADKMRPTGCRVLRQAFDDLKKEDRCMIPWGQAVSAKLPPFSQKGAAVCAAPIVKGIAKLLGMEVVALSNATGDVDTDLLEKGTQALRAAATHPFVLLHINGADEAAHRKDPCQKKAFLQKVDDVLLTMLLCSGHDVYVTADHGTDPITGKHLSDKQPVYTNVPEISAKKVGVPKKKTEHTDPMTVQRRRWAMEALRAKAKDLGRLPIKTDFSEIDKIKIKQALGPWPRALEAAGLKEPKASLPQKRH